MEGKCCKYERVTKYKCLECLKFREDLDIYNKEEKSIGKCENCDGSQVAVKRKGGNKK